jgi:hypothetical protein
MGTFSIPDNGEIRSTNGVILPEAAYLPPLALPAVGALLPGAAYLPPLYLAGSGALLPVTYWLGPYSPLVLPVTSATQSTFAADQTRWSSSQ